MILVSVKKKDSEERVYLGDIKGRLGWFLDYKDAMFFYGTGESSRFLDKNYDTLTNTTVGVKSELLDFSSIVLEYWVFEKEFPYVRGMGSSMRKMEFG